MWTETGLSYVASAIGKPLYVDSMSESMARLSYARICCDVDASKPLIDEFKLKLNADHVIRMEYQWKPPTCDLCKVFGRANKDKTRHPEVVCESERTLQH
ncbi:hypothetical protein Droror1_Dr00018179 [Drosera rotundifolia]